MSEEPLEVMIGGNFRDDEGKLYLVRCPSCKLENYAMAVSSGQCAWCGWKEDKSPIEEENP